MNRIVNAPGGAFHEERTVLVFILLALPLAAASSVPTAKPEDVGISSERLQRISQMIQRRIAAGEMSGAVAIVARKGEELTMDYHFSKNEETTPCHHGSKNCRNTINLKE